MVGMLFGSYSRILVLLAALSVTSVLQADDLPFTRDIDVIYHKQGGYALTMDRLTPRGEANGAAVIGVISGRWISKHEFLAPQVADQLPGIAGGILNPTELLRRGYTVFYVVHGAQPLFTIPEIHAHLSAAVRHIRHNAERYGVDPSRIGIMGGSAGGHLSLLQGTRGLIADDNPKTQAEQSSRVQAVVSYFPPTDFVNYGTEGQFFIDFLTEAGGANPLQTLDLADHDDKNFLRDKVKDEARLTQHYRDIAPYYHVSADDPPTLLIHGDADDRVPVQQSGRIAERFQAEGVVHKLQRKAGGAHGWTPDDEELNLVADWFDTHLAREPKTEENAVDLEVEVTGGAIHGIEVAGLKQYLGIPYTAPPVGNLRWAPPAPVVPWKGVRDASAPGPICPQRKGNGGSGVAFYGPPPGTPRPEQNEDCLTLNVWSKATRTDEARPVMVWIHGGGLVAGSSARLTGRLLAEKGAVVVSMNYRLGQLGFFAHPELSAENSNGVSGNQGFRDQIQALQWVRDNIEKFGGDPDNVTIFGESSGGTSVAVLQASPLAKGLFHRAIGQSGAPFHPMRHRTRDYTFAPSGESNGLRFGAALVGEDADQSLAALRKVPADKIHQVTQSSQAFRVYEYFAMVDGEVLVEDVATTFANGQQNDVPTLVGATSDETSVPVDHLSTIMGTGIKGFQRFTASMLPGIRDEIPTYYPAATDEQAMQSWRDLFNNLNFHYPMRAWARGMENVKSDAYLYWFSWRPPIPDAEHIGAFHGSFQMYLFGDLKAFKAKPSDADRRFSEMLAETWVRFARTGNPNGGTLPEWPAFTVENEAYMELGAELRAGNNLEMPRVDLIGKAWAKRRQAAMGGEGEFKAGERLW